ncbi:uncharacterized protein TM35_002051000 [Trypanosoma theileri]|uniref:Uncharacterized protein n=1 Tax=Trypanosoma theileri TaxID=67003 RepID=A0A1X0ND60_9TRYP|nr:uncharacterized protein TM35_002051000 [Trypanosoma theileri]ORC79582.1 hypothetical protein TM35_002051000 [Trypanosoma theileri]
MVFVRHRRLCRMSRSTSTICGCCRYFSIGGTSVLRGSSGISNSINSSSSSSSIIMSGNSHPTTNLISIRTISTGMNRRESRCSAVNFVLSPLRAGWRRFRAQRFLRKCATLTLGVLLSCCGYLVLCAVLQWRWEAGVASLFVPHEEFPLEEWAQVEPTLREGDVVLMMGTGSTSRRITWAQFAYSLLRPAALRYSHVGVVVEPAQFERWPLYRPSSSTSSTSTGTSLTTTTTTAGGRDGLEYSGRLSTSTIADMLRDERLRLQRKQKRGVVMMEVVDNLDVNAPDVNGKVRHECVQLVEASHRLFGREGERWCYNRFAVRRLKGFEWTPQRKGLLRQYVNENVGRPLDKSPLLVLSFIHPKLYEWTGARRTGREISCAEMIVDLYKHCGVIQKRMRLVPVASNNDNHNDNNNNNNNNNTNNNSNNSSPHTESADVIVNHDGSSDYPEWYYSRPSIQTAPCHFAEGLEVGVLDFAEGISLGPEVRMSLPGGLPETAE